MKRTLIPILVLLLSMPMLLSAKVPVEEDIKARVSDPASPYYYPNLLLRYEQADSTLTDDDYHYLYYGYAYQPQYTPLENDPALDRFYDALSRMDIGHPDSTALQQLVRTGKETLTADPFSPQVLNLLSFAYAQLGDLQNAAVGDGHERIAERDVQRGDDACAADALGGENFLEHEKTSVFLFGSVDRKPSVRPMIANFVAAVNNFDDRMRRFSHARARDAANGACVAFLRRAGAGKRVSAGRASGGRRPARTQATVPQRPQGTAESGR